MSKPHFIYVTEDLVAALADIALIGERAQHRATIAKLGA